MELKLESKIKNIAEIIEIILSAENLSVILNTDDVESLDQEYQYILTLITNSEFDSIGAAAKLKTLRDLHQMNVNIVDAAGTFTSNGYKNIHKGSKSLFQNSNHIFILLKYSKTRGYTKFTKYLPENIEDTDEGQRVVHLGGRGIPLSNLKLETDQVIYIFGELLKFVKWMNESGYYHLSLAPENIFFIPQTQTIKIAAFYKSIKIKGSYQFTFNVERLYENWIFRDAYPLNGITISHHSRVDLYDLYSIKAIAASLLKSLDKDGYNNDFLYFLFINIHDSNDDALKQFKKLFKEKQHNKIIL